MIDPVNFLGHHIFFLKINTRQGLTGREWLALHAEVKALQQQHGLSYKDSTHRLYMAEVEKVRALDTAQKSFSEIRQRIDSILDHEIIPSLSHIKTGTVKSHITPDQHHLEE